MGLISNLFHITQLESEIQALTEKKYSYESSFEKTTYEHQALETKIKAQKELLSSLQENIDSTKGQIICEELKAYSYPSKKTSSETLEKQLKTLNNKITSMISKDEVIINTSSYNVNGSASKGAEFQKFYGESLLISFNNYFDKKAKTITVNNYAKTRELIETYFNKMNRRASIIGDSLEPRYLNLKLQSLKLLLDIKITAAEERAQEIEEKRRLREQEKLLQEAEKAKAELAKERRMYEQSLAKALTEAERAEFEAKLKEIDKREADIDYRVNNARAGYLYITATDAMPNIVKLGVTRRLNPLVRIHELSSASVPFPFVCYGLVFSDNAFDLETKIHDYFDKQRVNKNNRHKEFFNISPQEAIDVLRNKFKCEVHFVDDGVDEVESEEE